MRKYIWLLCIMAMASSVPGFAENPIGAGDMKAILDLYGRTDGFCAVISAAGDIPGPCLDALASHVSIIHVIVADAKARQRCEKMVTSLLGKDRIMVENLAMNPLPYLDNMVNLVVVDQLIGKSPQRVTWNELGRVLTPGGTLAVRVAGTWKISRKGWPDGMDEWSHPNHDSTGNRYSPDKFVRPPFGYKWIDGVPSPEFYFGAPPNFPLEKMSICRAWVIANGRFYAVSASEPENFGLKISDDIHEYLVARDAFNGLLLWKKPIGLLGPSPGLNWRINDPLAAGKDLVYTVQDGKLTGFEAKSGKTLFTCESTCTPVQILVSGNTLAAACWEKSIIPDGSPAKWVPQAGQGFLTGYNAHTGAQLWRKPVVADNILAADGALFALAYSGTPVQGSILACDLATGQERFNIAFGKGNLAGNWQFISAGDGYLLMTGGNREIVALSSRDGTVLWRLKPVQSTWGPVIDGQFWHETSAYDVKSGKLVKRIPLLYKSGNFGCTPAVMVNNLFVSPKFQRYLEVVNDEIRYHFFRGARAGCIEGITPAEGMFFTSPENCNCIPVHPYGFVALGPVGSDPTTAEFERPHQPEHGAAFGSLDETAAAANEWSTYRGNTERSSSSSIPGGFEYRIRWETKIFSSNPSEPELDSRRSRCLPHFGPPVYGCGKIFVTAADQGEVAALDEKTGAVSWRYRAGSRIDTSPTIYRGGCFFGCNDGYIYALTARAGKMIWRVRVAPREQRMMDHGVVESVWPVYGSVLVYNDTVYASAGRNTEADGGIVIAAFNPATGAQKWARHIDVIARSKNDIIAAANGKIVWQNLALDPKTGEGDMLRARVLGAARSGMWDTTNLSLSSNRRVGATFTVDDKKGWQMAWDARHIVGSDVSVRPRDGEERKTTSLFTVPGTATAIVSCPNVAILGYGGPFTKKGQISVYTFDNTESNDLTLDAGVVHNGIAVLKDGLAVVMENGDVANLESIPVKSANTGFAFRVNCGGKEYKDANGNIWAADQAYKPGGWGVIGGGTADRSIKPLKKFQGADVPMYLTERFNASAYRFAVPNGRYRVTLHFAETYLGDDMELPNADLTYMHRRFNVSLNSVEVLNNFEPLLAAGGNYIPVVRQFETQVVNGELTVQFEPLEQVAEINGIEIVGLAETSTTIGTNTQTGVVKPNIENMVFPLRVNCGGNTFKDSHDNTWSADQEYKEGSWGYLGGNFADRRISPHKAMNGTTDNDLYLTERYGLSAYRFTVPAGKYTVTLHFNETYFGPGGPCEVWGPSNGPRRFNVTMNGKRILTEFNPLQEAGGANFTPVVKSFDTDAPDGQIEIRFTSLENGAEINGIEIMKK